MGGVNEFCAMSLSYFLAQNLRSCAPDGSGAPCTLNFSALNPLLQEVCFLLHTICKSPQVRPSFGIHIFYGTAVYVRNVIYIVLQNSGAHLRFNYVLIKVWNDEQGRSTYLVVSHPFSACGDSSQYSGTIFFYLHQSRKYVFIVKYVLPC